MKSLNHRVHMSEVLFELYQPQTLALVLTLAVQKQHRWGTDIWRLWVTLFTFQGSCWLGAVVRIEWFGGLVTYLKPGQWQEQSREVESADNYCYNDWCCYIPTHDNEWIFTSHDVILYKQAQKCLHQIFCAFKVYQKICHRTAKQDGAVLRQVYFKSILPHWSIVWRKW